jgi:integrase
VGLFALTAMRRAELRLLQRGDIELSVRRIIVRHGKGGKQRIVYIPRRLSDELREFLGNDRCQYIFPGRAGGPMSLRNLNYILQRVGLLAGIPNPNPRYNAISPHLLRHSFARNWKRAGGSFESLQRILGHSSLKTTLDVYGTESQIDTELNYRALEQSLVV